MNEKDAQDKQKPGLFSLILSTMAAAIGVQSNKNREKDFSQTSPLPYIIAGVVFTAVFILVLVGITRMVVN